MRRISWAVPLLVVISSVGAFANSANYTITSATFYIFANGGEGDNVFYTMLGPGVNLAVLGGTASSLFDAGSAFAPGSIAGGSQMGAFDFDFISGGRIGPYGAADIQLNCCSTFLSVGTFTFPLNGKNFTIRLPASFYGIAGTIISTGQSFNLTLPPGKLTLTFDYSPVTGSYYFNQGTFSNVPEPGTLGLMGTGLVALLGLVRRKLST